VRRSLREIDRRFFDPGARWDARGMAGLLDPRRVVDNDGGTRLPRSWRMLTRRALVIVT
jgi:hypothetical protein